MEECEQTVQTQEEVERTTDGDGGVEVWRCGRGFGADLVSALGRIGGVDGNLF